MQQTHAHATKTAPPKTRKKSWARAGAAYAARALSHGLLKVSLFRRFVNKWIEAGACLKRIWVPDTAKIRTRKSVTKRVQN